MGLYTRTIVLDRKNMTDNLAEYQEWIECCLNAMDKTRIKIAEKDNINYDSFEYGIAVGLDSAIKTILGAEYEKGNSNELRRKIKSSYKQDKRF